MGQAEGAGQLKWVYLEMDLKEVGQIQREREEGVVRQGVPQEALQEPFSRI